METRSILLPVEANRGWARCIFEKLLRLAPDLLTFEKPIILEAEGYINPICLEVIESDPSKDCRYIQMHHCWTDADGDPISDPRIVIVLYPSSLMAEAVVMATMTCFDEAYPVSEGGFDEGVYARINNYLELWLDSLLDEEQIKRVSP